MTDAEIVQIRYLHLAQFRQIENVQFQMELGTIEGNPSERFAAVGQALQNDPLFRATYLSSRNQHRPEFVRMMDDMLEPESPQPPSQ